MVDQQHAGVVVVTNARARLRRSSGTSASGKPGRRLVEQDEAWSRRERAGDAEAPLVALRERVGGRIRLRGETERVEQLGRPAPCLAGGRADAERRDLDVLAHRERPEGVTVLERPRQARAVPGGSGSSG